MKNFLSLYPFIFIFFATTACQSQCHRCGWINRNPVTPKDNYYQDYYESNPLVSCKTPIPR